MTDRSIFSFTTFLLEIFRSCSIPFSVSHLIFPLKKEDLISFIINSWKDLFQNEDRGHQPSGLGLPSTFMTSAWVGFCPKALKTSPHCAYVIFISDLGVRSKSEKASLNSERQKDRKKCMPCSVRLSQSKPRPSP